MDPVASAVEQENRQMLVIAFGAAALSRFWELRTSWTPNRMQFFLPAANSSTVELPKPPMKTQIHTTHISPLQR